MIFGREEKRGISATSFSPSGSVLRRIKEDLKTQFLGSSDGFFEFYSLATAVLLSDI